jgi:putative FmdB family regulatory protein
MLGTIPGWSSDGWLSPGGGEWYPIGCMPLYEYRCAKCGRRFEKLRKFIDREKPAECPDCRSEEAELQVSGFATGGCGPGGGRGGFT